MFVHFVNFIVLSVVEYYFAQWLTILSIAQTMIRPECGVMFYIA